MTADSSTLRMVLDYSRLHDHQFYALEYAAARKRLANDHRLCVKPGVQDDPTRHHPAAACFRCSDGVEVGRPWWAEVRKER